VRVDEFLNGRGIELLQQFQHTWLPGRAISGSKADLLRCLREAMLDPWAAGRVHRRLGKGAQRCLRALLRAPGFGLTIDQLAAKLPDAAGSPELVKDIATLTAAGLVLAEPAGVGSSNAGRMVTVPQELAERLLELLQIDRRAASELLASAGNSPGSSSGQAASAARQRLAQLPSATLRKAVAACIEQHGGLAGRRQLQALGLGTDRETLASCRAELEGAKLGTIGDLALWEFGIDFDETCLVIDQRLVDAVLAAREAEGAESVACESVGTGFLSNLRGLAEHALDRRLLLTRGGQLHKAAARRLARCFAVKATYFFSEEQLCEATCRLARRLGLVDVSADGRLRVRPDARQWTAKPLRQQLIDAAVALAASTADGQTPSLALRCTEIALQLAREAKLGRWYPAEALAQRVACRLLLRPATRGRVGEAAPAAGRSPTLQQVKRELAPRALAELHAIGVWDVALRKHLPVAFRLGRLAAQAFGRCPAAHPSGKALIVNPDFEVIVLPEGDVGELLYQLDCFCERGKQDQTHHLKITKGAVQRAAAGGVDCEHMTTLLQTHSRVEVPQNVVYSIENWCRGVRVVRVAERCILETGDGGTMDLICELPAIRQLVVRRIAPTAAVLAAKPTDDKTLAALKRLGVYLRDE